MTLKDDIVDDLAENHFNTDEFGESVTYNGSSIPVGIINRGVEEDSNSVFEFLEVSVRHSDIASVTYLTDQLVYDGLTWQYPRVFGQFVYVKKIRWIRNQRPKVH